MKFLLLPISILLGVICAAQENYPYQQEFENAYQIYPEIPDGLLEAVAFHQTRMVHLTGNHESCFGLPQVSGVMGLVEDGEGYFKDNLISISLQTGNSIQAIKTDPLTNILSYAEVYSAYMIEHQIQTDNFSGHRMILRMLSEIPLDHNPANQFALDAFVYEVFRFLNNQDKQLVYNFPAYDIDLEVVFGSENLAILSSGQVIVDENGVSDSLGNQYELKTAEYGPALWVATPTCNYSSRAGTPISAVTVHTIQGTYAGAISWAQNCSANVSYHYVVRSSDGQVTQMLYEADKGWHVGSENPYTIGIEHEGYVDNPAWYTTALYTSSADLVRDITQSGYGINPLRTFQGPATAGLNTLGSCVRIKGHQHYPSQTHTDPGINWNWEYYYQLINNTPSVTSYTTNSGTIFDSGGGTGNYGDDERFLYLIEPTGVVNISISFNTFSLENNWDYLFVYDGNSTSAPVLDILTGSSNPGIITSTGDQMLIEFRSDCNTTAAGYEIVWSSVPGPVPGDVIPPITDVDFSTNWKTNDFTATFTDADNTGGSGVHHQLYQVIDYDGTEWRANSANGFFSDNFDGSIHPEWTTVDGSWSIVSDYLYQSDEADDNTNIYAALDQDNDDVFLYHWAGKISGSGSNKRAGFHFMCDNPALTNRGNSYFVWFRSDNNKIQIYKVISDVFYLEADVPYTINDNQWYDFKTVFDKSTGTISVWVDNSMEASWTDSSPYTTGNSISFRTGNAVYEVNNLKVYHNRGSSELITVGASGDLRYQNPDPLISAGKVKSIVIDSAANVSAVSQQLVDVDWTPPADVLSVNDGSGADINVTGTNTELKANWSPSSDPNSDIARYWYAIGTASGLTDVVNWTDNWYDTTVTHSGLSLTYGVTYYFSVRAENGAGLLSSPVNSDGQLLQIPTSQPTASFIVNNTYVCTADSIQFQNSSLDATTYIWSVPGANPSSSTAVNPWFQFPVSATYAVTLIATGPGGSDTTVQLIPIDALDSPVASFTPSETLVDITNPFVTFANSSVNANGYYWDFGDGATSSDVNPWHEFTTEGTFTVMLIAVNGSCPNDTAFTTIYVVSNLSLNGQSTTNVRVYPNPSEGPVMIKVDEGVFQGPLILELTDMEGRLILSHVYNTSETMIILDPESENLSKGVYNLSIGDAENRVCTKLILN